MKRFAGALAVVLLAACGGGDSGGGSTGTPQAPSPAPLPTPTPTPTPLAAPSNVVVFLIDDLPLAEANFSNASVTRHYTPAIDSLAAQSIKLDSFHTVTPICTPSRFSLLTGSYPSRAKSAYQTFRLNLEGVAVPEFTSLLTAGDATLPKRLRALGYRTGFTGKDHVVEHQDYLVANKPASSVSLSDPGIQAQLITDQETAQRGMRNVGFDEAYSVVPGNPLEWPVRELQSHNLDWTVEGAKRFIDNNHDKKFFLVVSLSIPHGPLNANLSWNANPRMTPFGYLDTPLNVMPARSTLTSRVNGAGFPGDENYLWLDDSVAAVLDALETRGVKDKTAIFLLGDHGTAAKGTIYRSGSLTPGFVRYRNRTGRIGQLVANIDLQPTILQMLGGQPAGDGVSMMPLLEGGTAPIRDHVYLELGYARSVLTNEWQYIAVRHSDFIRQRSAIKGFPLAHWPNHESLHILEMRGMPLFPRYLDLDQLYDVQNDPAEQVNLYGQPQYQTIATQLRTALQAEAAKTPGKFQL